MEPSAIQEDKAHELTASGRRKKPDKWANMLKAKLLAFDTLSKTAAQLEEERSRLRDKEFLLVQVLETLQALVVDAVSTQPAAAACAPSSTAPARTCAQHQDNHSNASNSPAACSCEAVQDCPAGPAQTSSACQHAVRPAHSAPAAPAHPAAAHSAPSASQQDDSSSLLWMLVLEAVQQREAEISRMYGLLASSVGPHPRSTSMQQQMQEMLKAVCSKDNVPKVGTMTEPQLTSRLSSLAGQIALQLLAVNTPHPVEDPALATISGPLRTAYLEYSTLAMTALVWHSERFHSVLQTNLDTQEMVSEPLSKQHWLKALHQLKLTEQQLHVLSSMYKRYRESVQKIAAALECNMRQQAAHNVCVENLLQQHQKQQECEGQGGSSQSGDVFAPAAAGAVGGSGPGGAGGAVPASASNSSLPDVGATPPQAQPDEQQQQMSTEALIQEQHRLMRQWRLLGLHLGIVTICTLSTYQQALFVTGCYPSVSRMDMAIAAWIEEQQQQAQTTKQQQPQVQTAVQQQQQEQTAQQQQQELGVQGGSVQSPSDGPSPFGGKVQPGPRGKASPAGHTGSGGLFMVSSVRKA